MWQHDAFSQGPMHRTIFTTPVVNTFFRWISIGFLRLSGWKVEGALSKDCARSVLIAAPHTSNWDLPYTLMVAFVLRLNVYWLGKATIFTPPFAGLMRWLGGVPVDRSQANNLVESAAKSIREAGTDIQLIVPPEGTRSKTRYWKTGFYYIALGAQVPIIMAYLDYPRKVGGLGPSFKPTGDIAQDMVTIKAFYAQFEGKNAGQFEA
jgi:1-acyl-sn-glycerol-3-phosphate acyltransferase